MQDNQTQSMRVIATALTVAMEEMVRQGKEILAEEKFPDAQSETIRVAVNAMEETIKAINLWQESGDLSQMDQAMRMMTEAQRLMGTPPWETR